MQVPYKIILENNIHGAYRLPQSDGHYLCGMPADLVYLDTDMHQFFMDA